jgi:sRNA-binding protein
MNQEQHVEVNALIARLATLFPQTFFIYEQRRQPLKVGIHHDLAGVMPERELNMALGMYTRNTGYLRSMQEGAERIDLSGNPVGVVTAEQAVGAANGVDARMQHKLETARERKIATHKKYVEAWATVDKLIKLYPLAFFVSGRKRRPLKLDILKDLVEIGMSECEVANALVFYAQSFGYLKSLQEGAERLNLAGEPTGLLVTADEAAEAAAAATAYRAKIKRRQQKREATNLDARACPTEQQIATAPVPEMAQPIPEMAQPKRRLLGLADLKAAAMARRNNMETANA